MQFVTDLYRSHITMGVPSSKLNSPKVRFPSLLAKCSMGSVQNGEKSLPEKDLVKIMEYTNEEKQKIQVKRGLRGLYYSSILQTNSAGQLPAIFDSASKRENIQEIVPVDAV